MRAITELRQYQWRISDFIADTPNCAIWAAMGLGKTAATLTAVTKLAADFSIDKVLIVGPLRVARKVWSDEVKEWAHLKNLRVSVACGDKATRIAALEKDADIYLINRENIPWLCQRYVIRANNRLKQIAVWPWDMVVLDESDSYKSQSSERFKWLKRVRRLFPRMVQLTGTPVPHSYGDLWSQMKLLDNGQRLGDNEKSFKLRWFNPPVAEGKPWVIKPGADAEIRDKIKDIVISLRTEDYLELPPVMYNFIKVELPPKAKALYKELEKKFIAEIMPDLNVTAVNGGALVGKLMQMAGGGVYVEDPPGVRKWVAIHDEKLNALIDTIELSPGKVMVAYTYKHELERIEARLTAWCKEHKRTYRVMQTEADENDWNAGKVDILLLHPLSGGHGLNLQHSGSETIIWFGVTPNLGTYDQLNARLAGGHRRVGKNIVIHHLMAEDTVDVLMSLPRLQDRSLAQQTLLEMLTDRVKKVMSHAR